MRLFIAILAGKLASFGLRLLGRKGTYLSGKIALKLCPGLIGQIRKPAKVLAVTGTNGKTTVTNLISDGLEAMGVKTLSNRYGSNIAAGVASALIDGVTLSGKPRYDTAVLECDERSSKLIFPGLKPDAILITNLFRDSMRRNAHSEYIASFLTANIPAGTKLVLNADDLISSGVAPDCPRMYFGFDRQAFEAESAENIVIDARICPKCAGPLTWDFRRYNHIGRAHCEKCGFASPVPDVTLRSVYPETLTGAIEAGGQARAFRLHGDAIYNMYNTLAAVAGLLALGYTLDQASVLDGVKIVGSRYTDETIGKRRLTMIMAKGLNAVACSRSFDYVRNAGEKSAVVLMLDDVFDEKKSSENIAWLYDADFELLAGAVQVVTVGARRWDSRLRLLIAGVPDERITPAADIEDAAIALGLGGCERVFLLYELYREADARKLYAMIAERMGRTE